MVLVISDGHNAPIGCRAGGRLEAARRAGLEVVEKVLTTSILAANRTALRTVKR
jgi:hypothetical protein